MWMNYIQYVVFVLWPHKIVKCSTDAQSRILMQVVGHFNTFCLLFNKYCEFRHTALFAYCFLPAIKQEHIQIRMQAA